MPTFSDYMRSSAWWVSGLIIAVIGGILTVVFLRVFRTAGARAARYWATRSKKRMEVFEAKVAHLSRSPMRFTLVAARQSSLEAATPLYDTLAFVLIFTSWILPKQIQGAAVWFGFLSMTTGLVAQFRSTYMLSLLTTALERYEQSSNQAMQPVSLHGVIFWVEGRRVRDPRCSGSAREGKSGRLV